MAVTKSYCGCAVAQDRQTRKDFYDKGQMYIGLDPASAAKAYIKSQLDNLSVFDDKPDENKIKKMAKEYKDMIDLELKKTMELAEKERQEDLKKAKELGEKFFRSQVDRLGTSAVAAGQFNEV